MHGAVIRVMQLTVVTLLDLLFRASDMLQLQFWTYFAMTAIAKMQQRTQIIANY
jgi:hypothetical protein